MKAVSENEICGVLCKTILVLFFLNVIGFIFNNPVWQLERLFYMGFEANFSTWFSSMMFAAAAFLSYQCSTMSADEKESMMTFRYFALGLLLMSCDEVAMIHENLGVVINKYFFNSMELHSEWIVFLGPFIIIVFMLFSFSVKKALSGSDKAAKFILLGAVVYVAGAFLMEVITLFDFMHNTFLDEIEVIIEETLEMIGVLLLIKGLLEHKRFLTRASAENTGV